MKKANLIKSLINRGICTAQEIKGLSEEEVATIENEIGHILPVEYREFLLAIGRRAGNFLAGTDIFIASLWDLRDEAIDLLRENHEPTELPPHSFVFSMHQGYEFTYFNLTEGAPPVYQYVEGNGPPVLCWKSFSDFRIDAINQPSKIA